VHLIPVESIPVVRSVTSANGTPLVSVGATEEDLVRVIQGHGLLVDLPEFGGCVLLHVVDTDTITASVTRYIADQADP
jgi:hypothetical protein